VSQSFMEKQHSSSMCVKLILLFTCFSHVEVLPVKCEEGEILTGEEVLSSDI